MISRQISHNLGKRFDSHNYFHRNDIKACSFCNVLQRFFDLLFVTYLQILNLNDIKYLVLFYLHLSFYYFITFFISSL